MNDFSGDWSGKIFGTNNADIFVEINESDRSLVGIARINDPMYGVAIYTYKGVREGSHIHLEMDPSTETPLQKRAHTVSVNGQPVTVETNGINLGHVSVDGRLVDVDRLEGKWHSSIGTGGTFWLTCESKPSKSELESRGDESDNIVFIMMGISSENPALEDSLNAIKRAALHHGIPGVRVDEIEHSKKITDVILDKIKNSRFLVCDITNERPNVYYELGYAHGIGKEVILVADKDTKLHFDIKDYNIILYKNCTDLQNRVERRIEEAIGTLQNSTSE